MLPFEEILGYAFRKKLARAVEADAAQYVMSDHHSLVAEEIAQRAWTGDGLFDKFVRQCPFDFVLWLCSMNGSKIKIKSTMDIARNHTAIWYLGSIVDVWLKTPLLTFNRSFPNEINVFKPTLCAADALRDHIRLAELLAMKREFETAYIDGFNPEERPQAEQLIVEANRKERV